MRGMRDSDEAWNYTRIHQNADHVDSIAMARCYFGYSYFGKSGLNTNIITKKYFIICVVICRITICNFSR